MEDHVRASGVTIVEGAVRSIQKKGRTVISITTGDDIIEGDQLVLAAGSWTSKLTKGLGTNLLLQPAKGYSVTIPDADHGGISTGMNMPCLVTDRKWCGWDAEPIASTATWTSPSVAFLKPTGQERPEASSL